MSGIDESPSHARSRSCGTCSLCCKVLGIQELEKPMNQWCPHCLKHGGCGIYETRPAECRRFSCEWLIKPIGDEWQPTRCKMVLRFVRDAGFGKLTVHVDPGSPLSWRREPFISQLRSWARKLLDQNGMVNIYLGNKVIAVLPDREIDLGAFKFGDQVSFRRWRSGSGWECEFKKIPAVTPGEDASSQPGSSTSQ